MSVHRPVADAPTFVSLPQCRQRDGLDHCGATTALCGGFRAPCGDDYTYPYDPLGELDDMCEECLAALDKGAGVDREAR